MGFIGCLRCCLNEVDIANIFNFLIVVVKDSNIIVQKVLDNSFSFLKKSSSEFFSCLRFRARCFNEVDVADIVSFLLVYESSNLIVHKVLKRSFRSKKGNGKHAGFLVCEEQSGST